MDTKTILPFELCETIEKLLFISMVKENQKICFVSGRYIDPPSLSNRHSLMPWIWRKISGESRDTNLALIEGVIKDATMLLERHPEHRDILIDALRESMRGIDCLKCTYSDHPGTLAHLEVISKQITLKVTTDRAEVLSSARARPRESDPASHEPVASSHIRSDSHEPDSFEDF
jgi:hypothetical protein